MLPPENREGCKGLIAFGGLGYLGYWINWSLKLKVLKGSCSSGVEHFLGKEEVMGSNPIKSST